MAIASITEWLKSENKIYAVGAALYERYGTKNTLKIILKSGNSPYHFNRLVDALQEINPQLTEAAAPAAPLIPTLNQVPLSAKSISLNNEQWAAAPEPIKDLYSSSSQHKSRAELLHHQIRANPNEEERLAMALQLLDDREVTNENFKVIKDFHEKGVVAEQLAAETEKSVDEMTIPELIQASNNIPTYITKKNKKLLAMVDGPKKNKVLISLQAYEIKLAKVNKRLKDVTV